MAKTRVLFVAENITLAQVVRLSVLADALPPERYEVHFASSGFDPLVFEGKRFVRHELWTLPAEAVHQALKSGKRLYELPVLERYVADELGLIDAVEPALVVGDFRLSLSVSAEKRGVPWAGLINAYWSPHAVRGPIPVPDHPIVRWLGEAMTERYFPQAVPRVFAHFAAPINRLRRRHRLPEIGSLLEVLTHADHTLYPDDPELLPLADAPPSHRFLGPVLWAPNVPLPALPDGAAPPRGATHAQGPRPLVYVTLGSSGEVSVLPTVLEALATLPVQALLATAGRAEPAGLPDNVRAARFVPGDRVAELAALVISNGGSTTGYQALAAGAPVLGLPSNLDQYLTMQAFVKAGVARQVKARAASAPAIADAVRALLEDGSHRARAEAAAARIARLDSKARFIAFVDEVTNSAPASAAREAPCLDADERASAE